MPKETLRLKAGQEGGLWRFRPTGERRRMHRHDELEFNLVTGGRASYLLRDRRYDLTPGTLIWLVPAREHLLLNESPDFDGWIAVFSVALVRRSCTTPATAALATDDPPIPHCLRLRPRAAERLGQVAERVADADDADYINAGLAYLLHEAWRVTRESDGLTGRGVHPAVERAAMAMRRGGSADDLPALAAEVGLSPSRLSRLFHEQTGQTVTTFRNRQRLERFFAAYGDGQHQTMLAAALGAGFGSYAQFHRAFKQQMGCGPAAYRRDGGAKPAKSPG